MTEKEREREKGVEQGSFEGGGRKPTPKKKRQRLLASSLNRWLRVHIATNEGALDSLDRLLIPPIDRALDSTRPRQLVPCVGRDTRKPPPAPPALMSPPSDIIDASATTLPSSPLGTGTGGGEEGRADLAKEPGAERPRYDHMQQGRGAAARWGKTSRKPPGSFFVSQFFLCVWSVANGLA